MGEHRSRCLDQRVLVSKSEVVIPPAAAGADDSESIEFSGNSFALVQCERAGLGAVAERIRSGQPLAREEIDRVAAAELPLLAKLVEWKRSARGGPQTRTDVADLVDLVDGVRAGVSPPMIVEANCPEEAEAGLGGVGRVVCRQRWIWDGASQGGFPTRFVDDLLRWRSWCNGVEVPRTWTLALSSPLEQGPAGPLGEDVVRAVALAALVLPDDVEIRVSVAEVGLKTAQVALRFGATRLAPVAMDPAAAEADGLPLLDDVKHVLELDDSR